MQFIHTLWNKPLNKIEPSQKVAALKSIELTDSVHPLLTAYLLYLRKLNGIHHKMDTLNKSSEMLRAFNYLCEHNLIFFLIATGQLDEVRKLFRAKMEIARMVVVVKKVRRKRAKARRKHHVMYFLHHMEQEKRKQKLNADSLDSREITSESDASALLTAKNNIVPVFFSKKNKVTSWTMSFLNKNNTEQSHLQRSAMSGRTNNPKTFFSDWTKREKQRVRPKLNYEQHKESICADVVPKIAK